MARGKPGSGQKAGAPKKQQQQERASMQDQNQTPDAAIAEQAQTRGSEDVMGDTNPDAIAEQDAMDAVRAEHGQQPEGFAAPKKERKLTHVTIIINAQESAGGNLAVPVQVNGKAWLIPREQEVKVPYEVLHALENAVAKETNWEGKTNTRTTHSRRRYPVSVIERHYAE